MSRAQGVAAAREFVWRAARLAAGHMLSAHIWLASLWVGAAALAVRGMQLIGGDGPAMLVASAFMIATARIIMRGMARA